MVVVMVLVKAGCTGGDCGSRRCWRSVVLTAVILLVLVVIAMVLVLQTGVSNGSINSLGSGSS